MGARGPKAKGGYGDKTAVLSTRITAPTRQALTEAAAKSGRSLSSEVEHRLRRSFDEDEKTIDRLGGPQLYAILRLISSTMDAVGKQAFFSRSHKISEDANWLYDPYCYDQVVKAVTTILENLRPAGDPAPRPYSQAEIGNLRNESDPKIIAEQLAWFNAFANNTGEWSANGVLSEIMKVDRSSLPLPNSSDPHILLLHRIANGLAPLLDKLEQTTHDAANGTGDNSEGE